MLNHCMGQMMFLINKKYICSTVIVLGLVVVNGFSTVSAAQWRLTPQSKISFHIKSLGLSTVKGNFNQFQSKMRFDPLTPNASRLEFQMDSRNVTLSSPALKNLILGSDYFFVEKYNTVKFVSSSVQQLNTQRYSVKGNLTIRGVTQPVVFDTQLIPNVSNVKLLDVHAKTVIDRTSFGMKKSLGGVGEKVNIEVKGQWKMQ